MLLTSVAFVFTINDFLIINRPVDADILVVEGWIWQSPAMKEAVEEFHRRPYARLVAVGSIEPDTGTGNGRNVAELAAKELRRLGINEAHIIVLPVSNVALHRTYASALTLRNWLVRSKMPTIGINVFTVGAHARKSLILFRRAFGPSMRIGVIAGTEHDFDPRYWWMSSRGVYATLRKTAGYLYAVLWPLPDNLID